MMSISRLADHSGAASESKQRTLWGNIFPAPLRFEERKHYPVSGEHGFARHDTHPAGREVHTKGGGVSVGLVLS
jgi:hypothetical protein